MSWKEKLNRLRLFPLVNRRLRGDLQEEVVEMGKVAKFRRQLSRYGIV